MGDRGSVLKPVRGPSEAVAHEVRPAVDGLERRSDTRLRCFLKRSHVRCSFPKDRRLGISLLEMLAVVTVMGILAVIVIPRFSVQAVNAKRQACFVNKNNIEVQCQLWFRQKGVAPTSTLSDIRANTAYFPEGVPTCPVDGSSYTISSTTQRVLGHTH